MVRNSILIFCLCVCFCQYHISVSLYTHLYTHIINKLLHGWFVCTIFIIQSLRRIAKLTRSLRSLVRLTILHNSWIKIVRTHQPWSNLYVCYWHWPLPHTVSPSARKNPGIVEALVATVTCIGTLRFTERQRDDKVSRQRVIEKKWIIIVLKNSFEHWTRGHSIGMNSRATPLKFVCPRISHYACY